MTPRLNTPFVLETPQETPDGAGGFTLAWAPMGTLWGELRAGRGTERVDGAAGVAGATHAVVIRGAPYGSPSRPTVRQRLRRGVRVFVILGVRELDAAAKYLEVRVAEELAA